MRAEEALIYLSSCVTNGIRPTAEQIAGTNSRELMQFAETQQMKAIAATGMKLAGIQNEYFSPDVIYPIIYKNKLFDTERQNILKLLEKNKIWYMPLKGIILKDLYPQPFLREMADNDILFDKEQADTVYDIMTSLGYSILESEYKHHDHYTKLPFYNVEMHRTLIDETMMQPALFTYYSNIRERMIKDIDNEYGYHLSNEDFYIFMIAHEYKHFTWKGTGIRSLLDKYVYLKKYADKLNWNYIKKEIHKLGIGIYEKRSRKLALKIFTAGSIETLNTKEKKALDYYINSGAFGRTENDFTGYINIVGKIRFVLNRIFIPKNQIKEYYPFFHKHTILILFLPIYRLIKQRKNAIKEFKMINKI